MPLSRASSAGKRERARAYNKALPLTIRCLTWNVGNAKPVAAELAHALPDGLDEDIIVVGTQENSYKAGKGGRKRAVAQEKRAVAQESPEPTEKAGSAYSAYEPAPTPGSPHSSVGDTEEREEESAAAVGGGGKGHAEWEEMLARRLGRGYVPVRHVRLWEMRLSVYVKASQRANVTKVHVASAATGGPGGMLGNKGGLVVRLRLGATSLAFVSCHLAAHSHMLSRRNHNCSELLRETASALGPRHLTAAAQFDHVFWLGDLNYRTDLNAAAAAAGEEAPPEGAAGGPAAAKAARAGRWNRKCERGTSRPGGRLTRPGRRQGGPRGTRGRSSSAPPARARPRTCPAPAACRAAARATAAAAAGWAGATAGVVATSAERAKREELLVVVRPTAAAGLGAAAAWRRVLACGLRSKSCPPRRRRRGCRRTRTRQRARR
mmetsp:Transcript_29172/g.88436  ORF Transcript_29172/g.88436 Transcript_29172/m.88436 type:complete len:435 (-) Transcript_29172:789-2093(-)